MNMKKSEKREYIESILDLDIFSEMAELCKTDLSEERKIREGFSSKKETYASILEDYLLQKKEFEEKKNKNIKEIEERIQNLNKKIQVLKAEIDAAPEITENNYSEKITQAKNAQKIIEQKTTESEKLILS